MVGQQLLNPSFGLQPGDFIAGVAQGQNATFATLKAHAGGGAAAGTPVPPTAKFINIGTVATAADSLLLPFAIPGQEKWFFNNTATSATIYAQTALNPISGIADAINTGASGAGQVSAASFAIAAGVRQVYFCSVAGQWSVVMSA